MAPERRWCAPGARACIAVLAAVSSAHPALAQSGPSADPGDGESVTVARPSGSSPTVLPQLGSAVPASVSLEPGFSATELSDQLQHIALGVPVPPSAGWVFTPSIGVTQEYDAGSPDGTGPTSSWLASLSPAFTLSGSSSRVQADVSYAPVVRLYESGGGGSSGDGDRVSQDFAGHALVTLAPQTLFVDLRGSASEQSRFGGLGPANTTTLPTSNTSQTYSFAAAPYAVHRFGDAGTAELGVSYSRTLQDSATLDATQTGSAALAAGLNEVGSQNVSTRNVHAAFETGTALGRYNAAVLATATSDNGSGVLHNAHRDVLSVDNGYAITRTITALARIGYEDIHYGGTAPVDIRDLIWDGGVRVTPDAASSITARYGHHDGLDALTLDASVAPTARTRLYAQYSAGLSTQLEDLQNALATADIDALGAPVDHSTGTPLYLSDSIGGSQAGLYRLHRYSAGGELLLDRNVFSLSFNRDERHLVSSPSALATGLGLVADTTDSSASVSWSRELSPTSNAILYLQYGVNRGGIAALASSGQAGDANTIVVSLSGSKQLTDTISLTALYSYSSNSGSDNGNSPLLHTGSAGAHRVLVGLRKTF